MVSLKNIIDRAQKYLPELDQARLRKAYRFSKKAHSGQVRYSGAPYISHPLATMDILLSLKPDEDTLVAAMLHDVPEDTPVALVEIEEKFGKKVARLVADLGKLSVVRARSKEAEVDNLRKMFLTMAKDLRVVLIKLADRLHNMQTLKYVPAEKRYRIARETREIFAPIANRLGLHQIKNQLEDLCFLHLSPREYDHIMEQLEKQGKIREEYIDYAKKVIQKVLKREGIEGEVTGRLKHKYSIYSKMKTKGKNSVDEIFDVFAMRIILPDKYQQKKEIFDHCYQVLGLVHNQWTPIPRRFKDYIAMPKVNGYRSLHTTVLGLGVELRNQPTEIQIRTQSLHREAEFGIASHWWYSSTNGFSTSLSRGQVQEWLKAPQDLKRAGSLKAQVEWLSALAQLQQEIENNSELVRNLKVDIFKDRIFVLTPMGEVKDFPVGATPVDFAYAIHTEIGHKCHMAKINGQIVPLNYKLKNGEVVEVVTQRNGSPSRFWLSFVKTSLACNKIKNWLNGLDREKNIKVGRDMINQQLLKLSKPLLGPNLSLLRSYGGKRQTLQNREYVLENVGKGLLGVHAVLKKIFEPKDFVKLFSKNRQKRVKRIKKLETITIEGETNLSYKLGRCCQPKNSQPVLGYVTRGKGVTVHRRGCSVLKNLESERLVKARWEGGAFSQKKDDQIELCLEVYNRFGLVRDVTALVAGMGINIVEMSALRPEGIGKAKMRLVVLIQDYGEFEKLIDRLEHSLEGLIKVKKKC